MAWAAPSDAGGFGVSCPQQFDTGIAPCLQRFCGNLLPDRARISLVHVALPRCKTDRAAVEHSVRIPHAVRLVVYGSNMFQLAVGFYRTLCALQRLAVSTLSHKDSPIKVTV